jgi:hypothetical protein
MKSGIALIVLGVLLLATGVITPGLLGISMGLLIAIKSKATHRVPVVPHAPQRMIQPQEQAPMDWRVALSDVRTHVKDTGCLVRRSDFESKNGFCPNGGSYWEHD